MTEYNVIPLAVFSIAGLKFRPQSARAELNTIESYSRLQLKAEPTNEYDPDAIMVLSPSGTHLGYVPKRLTYLVRQYSEPNEASFYEDGVRAVLMEKGQDLIELTALEEQTLSAEVSDDRDSS